MARYNSAKGEWVIVDHPVLKQARKCAEQIAKCEEIIRFRVAEEQVNQSDSVQQLIVQIKKKQKELVHAKHYHKHEHLKQIEQNLVDMNERLDRLPIVMEYQQSQVAANDLIQMIQQIIGDTVSQKIEVEVGNPVESGCGSGGSCGCS
nr:YlbF family regulator [Polycladospora coralii]